ncbi:hypothetical protein AAFC00_003131 [Neodothiora populina]|uniref:BTB domain-containing protein n=1 Tax=Neodothiora populina TaxID=2781224 RepID=A0ABR3PAL9_9PEZI
MLGSSRNKDHGNRHHNDRVQKSFSRKQPSFSFRTAQKERSFKEAAEVYQSSSSPASAPSPLNSSIITLCVGPSRCIFAAHEEVLCHSPWFADILRRQSHSHAAVEAPIRFTSEGQRIDLPDQEAEVISSVLEYLYKGDYSPRLLLDKRRGTWTLEDDRDSQGTESVALPHASMGPVLKDTVIYCTADLYSLPELKRLALKKQGLHQGIQCATILNSARFAYDNTPDTDSRLRAHYLALIIRSRDVFRRSGTMQLEMDKGGRMWFDLFVALANHLDDVIGVKEGR